MNELDSIKQQARIITEAQRKDGYVSTGMYLYTDETGNVLYVRLRMDKPDGTKWIRPLSRDADGNWSQLKEPSFKNGKPLYNLHEIRNNPDKPVFIVEGEKCANSLIKLGLTSTTSGGATSAKDADWQPLAGRECIVWPDNDNAGKQYAGDVIAKLRTINANVKMIDIDALVMSPKADCVDWLASFKQKHGHDATIADVEALPLKTDAIQGDLTQNNDAGDTFPLADDLNASVSLICAADIKPEAIDWLWDGWLAKGKLHIFAGQAGTGKTTIAMALASTISTGGRFPDGVMCPQGSVLIWSGEDSPSDTLIPRLMASGANLSKIHIIGDTTTTSEGRRAFDPASDMQVLMLQAGKIQDLALMIIDPIVNAVAGDSHKNGEVRRALQPVVDFGERLKCAVLGITHFSKGGQGKDPLERVTGSLAFGALARIVLATAKITEGDTVKRIVCRAKSNIGIDSGGFEYELLEKEVQAGIFSSCALWGEAVEGSARELLSEPVGHDSDQANNSALDDAKQFLLELLADGELSQKQIEADAKGASHAMRTVRRAKDELGIISSKSKLDGRWYWRLSSNIAKSYQGVQDDQTNLLGNLGNLQQIATSDSDSMEF